MSVGTRVRKEKACKRSKKSANNLSGKINVSRQWNLVLQKGSKLGHKEQRNYQSVIETKAYFHIRSNFRLSNQA